MKKKDHGLALIQIKEEDEEEEKKFRPDISTMRRQTQQAAFHYKRILDLKGQNTKNRNSDQNVPQTVVEASLDLSSQEHKFLKKKPDATEAEKALLMGLPKISEDMLHLMEPLTASEDIAKQKGRILNKMAFWTDN